VLQTRSEYRLPVLFDRLLAAACLIVACCTLNPAQAQVVMGDKTVLVPKLDGELRIDGKLDEPQWAQALVVEDLHQYQPYEYSEPSQKTKVWIFYTADAL